jgi:hypothetical protein
MNQFSDYKFITPEELYSQPLEIDWLVEDYIPSDSIGMLYGASGPGKSDSTLSLAVSKVNEAGLFDHKTKERNSLILAIERSSCSPKKAEDILLLNKCENSLYFNELHYNKPIVFIAFPLLPYNIYRFLGAL